VFSVYYYFLGIVYPNFTFIFDFLYGDVLGLRSSVYFWSLDGYGIAD